MTKSNRAALLIFPLAVWLASCAQAPERPAAAAPAPRPTVQAAAPAAPEGASADEVAPPAEGGPARSVLPSMELGTGEFVRPPAAAKPSAGGGPKEGITLNFAAADLREVIKAVLGDILGQSYLLDEKVQGVVTIHTQHPVPREAVFGVLETILRGNGAALLRDGDMYRIVPLATAAKEGVTPGVGDRPRPGYNIQIVPLRYVAATEMKKILEPLLPAGGSLQVDVPRNLLMISAPGTNLRHLLDTIRIFDINQFKGQSFGFFSLEYGDAKTVTGELEKILGRKGQESMIRLMPIERLSSVLVMTQQPEYLQEVGRLIKHLDRGADSAPGRRLYVYPLKNAKADKLASILQELFTKDTKEPTGTPPPPTAAVGHVNPERFREAARGEKNKIQQPKAPPSPLAAAGTDAGASVESQGEVTIIADPDNNAILVLARPLDYRAVEAAIRRLDVRVRQVLIEATIAEVSLDNTLAYGVQWFLKNSVGKFNRIRTNFSPSLSGGPFTFSLGSDGSINLLFDLLNTVGEVNVLSSPMLLVVDNQSASINVGDQIPVVTRSAQGTTDPNAPIISEVQFRDTGVLLNVTPHINAGGLVTLEISQEVSTPGAADPNTGNREIAQRSIDSTVVVQSGTSILLGGLITQNNNKDETRIPVMADIPVFGYLFKNQTLSKSRTELILTITPTVIRDQREAEEATEEIRRRMVEATALRKRLFR